MNTKSKVFSVLSATACSKGGGGGGSHLSGIGGKPDKKVISGDNTIFLEKNIHNFGSGLASSKYVYIGYLGDRSNLDDYDYIQISDIAIPHLIQYILVDAPDNLTSKDKRHTNKNKSILIGNLGGDLYLAQEHAAVVPYNMQLARKIDYVYSGKAIHYGLDGNSIDLDMHLTVRLTDVDDWVTEAKFNGYLAPNDNKYKSKMSASMFDYSFAQGSITAETGSTSGLTKGSLFDGEFTDTRGNGFSGTYSTPDGSVRGVFSLDLQPSK